jgi:hypothetical protein
VLYCTLGRIDYLKFEGLYAGIVRSEATQSCAARPPNT